MVSKDGLPVVSLPDPPSGEWEVEDDYPTPGWLDDLVQEKEDAEEGEVKYRPDQPRAPSGTSEGGRWVSDASEVEVASEVVPENSFDNLAAATPEEVAALRKRFEDLQVPLHVEFDVVDKNFASSRPLHPVASLTKQDVVGLNGVADGLAYVRKTYPVFGKVMDQYRMAVTVGRGDPAAFMTFAFWHPGGNEDQPELRVPTGRFIYNTASQPLFHLLSYAAADKVPSSRAAVRAVQEVAQGDGNTRIEDVLQRLYRNMTYHEVGHMVDKASGRELSSMVRRGILRGARKEHGTLGPELAKYWLIQNVSQYATTSDREAAAEVFSMVVSGEKLPPSFSKFSTYVRETGSGRTSLLPGGKAWDPDKHPRHPSGTSQGGEFAPAGAAPVGAPSGEPASSGPPIAVAPEWLHRVSEAVDLEAPGERQFLQQMGALQDGEKRLAEGILARSYIVGEYGRYLPPDTVTPGHPRMAPQQCYRNSALTAASGTGHKYVEGYVFVHGVPIAHAWNEDKAGRPVDFTLRDPSRWSYIGVHIPNDVVMKVVTNDRFSRTDDGVLGAINLFPAKVRQSMLGKVLAANQSYRKSGGSKAWDPEEHPRHPAGTPQGGQFAPAGAPGEGSAEEDDLDQKVQFDAEYWASLSMSEARQKWGELSDYERDLLAEPTTSIEGYIKDLLGEEPWQDSGDTEIDISSRVDAFRGKKLVGFSADRIEEFSYGVHANLIAAGVSKEDARALAMKVTDYAIAQDFEAIGRSLGDHGIFHLSENLRLSTRMLEAKGGLSPKEAALLGLASAFHDSGYLAPPSRVFLDQSHPRWSAQNYMANLYPLVDKALGTDSARALASLIYAHDDVELDWDRAPLQSAFSTADNLALFHYEKMPALLRFVPGNLKALVDLGRKKIDVDTARESMQANIRRTTLPEAVKERLIHASSEVSSVLPKYTLGMVGIKTERVLWEKDHPHVVMHRHLHNEQLGKVLDFGQRQFSKLAETYNLDPKDFLSTKKAAFKKDGRTLLALSIEETILPSFEDNRPRGKAWDPEKHPRAPAGSEDGGQFVSAESSSDDTFELTGKDLVAAHGEQLASLAQGIYDDWDESDEDTYAGGGICHLIADAWAGYLSDQGVEATTVSSNYEVHVYAVAKLADGVWSVDLPYSIYERGGGYSWKKIPGVKFSPQDISMFRIDSDPETFSELVEMGASDLVTKRYDPDQPRDDRGRWVAVGSPQHQPEEYRPPQIPLDQEEVSVFHGTREELLQKILTEGLRAFPADERVYSPSYYAGIRAKSVFVSQDLEDAKTWALGGDYNPKRSPRVILEIKVPQDFAKKNFFEDGVARYPAIRSQAEIPPEYIRRVGIVTGVPTRNPRLWGDPSPIEWHSADEHRRAEDDGQVFYLALLVEAELSEESSGKAWDPAEHPREPAGSPEGGQFTESPGGASDSSSELQSASAELLAQAPYSSAGAALWRRKAKEQYAKDPAFKALVDTVSRVTQGDYDMLRRAVLEDKGLAEPPPEGQWHPTDKLLGETLHPLAKYKDFIDGQNLEKDSAPITVRQAGRLLERAIREGAPLDAPIYRGLVMPPTLHTQNKEFGRWLSSVKEGDDLELAGPTSFSASQKTAEDFAQGLDVGQRRGRGKGDPSDGVLLVVSPGARGVKVAALSPWKNQQEVLSSGRFRVTKVEGERPQKYRVPSWDFTANAPKEDEEGWAFPGARWEKGIKLRIYLEPKE